MSLNAFTKLQNAITKDDKFDHKHLKDALMFNTDSPETYTTFRLGLLKKILNPTELLAISSTVAITINNTYMKYVGLSLRYGANPNYYLNAAFPGKDGPVTIPIHIAKYIWDRTPIDLKDSVQQDMDTFGDVDDETDIEVLEARMNQKQITSLSILSMLALSGMVSDASVSNKMLLKELKIDPTNLASKRPEFFLSVNRSIANDSSVGTMFAQEIKLHEKFRGSPQDLYGRDKDRDNFLLKYAYLLDITQILSLPDVYGADNNLQTMFRLQDNNALKVIVPKLKVVGLIGKQNTKKFELLLLDWCIAYYNQAALKFIMEEGVEIDLNTRSQTIGAAKRLYEKYPVQAEILMGFLIKYVRFGYGLSMDQLNELTFSPKAQQAIRKEYSVPQVHNLCRIRTTKMTQELKELAAKVGIPLGSSKNDTCNMLIEMSKSNPSQLKQKSHEINRNKIQIMSTNVSDVVSGRKTLVEPRTLISIPGTLDDSTHILGSSSISNNQINNNVEIPNSSGLPSPICTNQDSLSRPIEDYPDDYRVTYSDGQNTWCFTSDHFRTLIVTGMNPWKMNSETKMLGTPLPDGVIDEMKRKLERIEKYGLKEKAVSISEGVDDLFSVDPSMAMAIYETESNKRLAIFYEFMESYGVPKERFLTLTSDDYQFLSDNVLSNITRVTVDNLSPQLALRDFADAVIIEAETDGNAEELGSTIASILIGEQ